MLTELCDALRNYFCEDDEDKHLGTFEISGGTIAPSDFLAEDQYFRIVGSKFNDGVWQHPAMNLKDETFDGAVWAMAVPPAVIALSQDVKEYRETAGKASPYTSESFGGYSYSKATGKSGAPVGWKAVFSDRMSEWRKIR